MRNALAKAFSFALLLGTLASCQKEYSIEGYSLNGPNLPPTIPPTNPPTNPPGTQVCNDCEYIPTCDGIQYTYKDVFSGSTSTRNITLNFLADTTIDGKRFRKIDDGTGTVPAFYNCTNGETRAIVYNSTTVGTGTAIQKADVIMIKSNAVVGATWDSPQDFNGQVTIYRFKIIAKGLSRAVEGQTYNDVIQVEMSMGQDVPGFGFVSLATSNYYYAKNIGLIETVTLDMFGAPSMATTLMSYNIP